MMSLPHLSHVILMATFLTLTSAPLYPAAAINMYRKNRNINIDAPAARSFNNSVILPFISCPFWSASSVPVDHPRQTGLYPVSAV